MKRFSRNYWVLFLFIGVVTVICYLTAGTSAAVPQNQPCLQCHSNIWGTTPLVDRTTVCGKCHNAPGMEYHPGVSNSPTPYGYFKSSASASGNASTVHPPHNGTNSWATYTRRCSCHAKANCTVCHTSIPHSTHSQPTKTFACIDCHKTVTVNNEPTGEFTQPNCTSCHPAHAAGCSLCHGTRYTMKDWRPSSHMKHEGKVLCGSCHGIPEKTALNSSGKYCAICHGKPMPYTTGNVAGIHKKHADAYGRSPDMCMSCHGKSVPAITPKTSCSVCHGTKYTATRTRTSEIHDEHVEEIDCAICHQNQVLPVAPKRETGKQLACLLCHEQESYRTPNEVHREEEHRSLWCDVCHDSNVPQGVKCVDCHGSRFVRPRTYTTSALHNDHAGRLMPCSVCHAGLEAPR